VKKKKKKFRSKKTWEKYILDKGERDFLVKFGPVVYAETRTKMANSDIWKFVVDFISKNYVPRSRFEETIKLLEMIGPGFRKISKEELIKTFKTLLK